MGLRSAVARAGFLLVFVLTVPPCFAQSAGTFPPVKIGPVTLTGSLRVRAESWNWFAAPADGEYTYPAYILRLGIGQQKKKFDWLLEAAHPLLLALPDNAIAPGAQGQLGLGATYFASNNRHENAAGIFVKQAFVRFKGLGAWKGARLLLGRFEFADGLEMIPKNETLAALDRDRISQRLIGPFGFSHVARSFDGAKFAYDTPKLNFTLVGARATRGVFQTDGMGELDVDFLYGSLTRPIARKSYAGQWRIFLLHYHDGRLTLKADNRPLALRAADTKNIRITTVGGHFLQVLDTRAGKFDALFWGALQTGGWGALDHRAGAAAVEAGYQPDVRMLHPWIRAGYFHGSGDGNPNDGKHTTFFQVLPTPRIYARFPFYNLENLEDSFAELVLRPQGKLTIRSDFHWLRLSDARDLWYSGGGAFQKQTFGYVGRPSGGLRGLANLFDVSADYQWNAHWALALYFANAQGHGVIASIYPNGQTAQFGYAEFTYRF